MTIEDATQILRDRGYQVFPMPEHIARPGYIWMSEPGLEDFDAWSERDVITLAEALQGNHRCYYCHEQAEYRCPICHRWLCWFDQRDWSPDFDQHWCPDCVGKHNAIIRNSLTNNDIHR